MKKYDVVALGELLIDFTENGLSAQGNPLLEANPGGAPCNVLSMLNNLGRKTGFIGRIGRDMFGDMLENALVSAGIDTCGLVRDPKVHTTLAFVHTKEGGDREFSFYREPGADMMLCEDDLKEEMIRDCRIFHFGTLSMTHEGCRKATKQAVKAAREAGALISFDPNIREPLWDSMETARKQVEFGLQHTDILKISDNELQWFSGKEDLGEGLHWLISHYDIPLVLLSEGRDGSRAVCGGTEVFVPAFLNEHTIETTGAGDTFCACVLEHVLKYGLDQMQDEKILREMLQYANAAASIITTRKGALRVMPLPSEINSFLRERLD